MKPTDMMMNVKFDGAREFIDFMNDQSKRLWISADDPQSMIFKAVDENLEYVLEITVADYKESEHLLNEEEQKVFRSGGGAKKYWELTGEKLSEHQEFLLSPEYWQGMANYLQRKFRKELKSSLLRINSEVEDLQPTVDPCYDVDPLIGAYFIDHTGETFVHIDGKMPGFQNRMSLPFFEIGQVYLKECDTIWDVKVDDFTKNEILIRENVIYKEIIEELGKVRQIVVPFRIALTVRPSMSWAHGRAGFSTFETLGVGIYPK